ncbi:MAG: hypothetical protein WD886_11760 [Burkholderiales bacterium]
MSHRNALLAGLALTTLAACGSSDEPCDPPPQIASTPPTTATVGVRYVYVVDASYRCSFSQVCREIEGVRLPAEATIDSFSDSVLWTPLTADANTDVPFQIATPVDTCGDRAQQSWTVHVNP